MRVSQRLDYAMRALTVLAGLPAGESVAAGEVADGLGLPRRFVEQALTALSASGLVATRRGPGGGCSLARSAREITVRHVIEALEGEVLDVPRVSASAVSEMWEAAGHHLAEHLECVTLADLWERQREMNHGGGYVYQI